MRTVHSANQLCIYGAATKWCGTNSAEASQSRPESARKTSPEIQMEQEGLKSLVVIPRLPHASGNRMLQNFEGFQWSFSRCEVSCEQFSLSTFADNFNDASFGHRLVRNNGIGTCLPKF